MLSCIDIFTTSTVSIHATIELTVFICFCSKEVHLEVDQSQVGAVRIFPSEIETAMSCSSVPGSTFPPKECRVTPVHEGECSDVPHRKRILRETGGCRWSEEDSKYYWTYELKSVMVNKTVLCARPKP